MALQFNGTPDTSVRAGVYEVTEEQNGASKDVGGDHEEVVRKISFAEILQQVKERDAQERQFGIDEDMEEIKSEHDYIGKVIYYVSGALILRDRHLEF